MAVHWRNRCTTVSEAFTYMLEKEILVDTVFKWNGGCRLFAHRLVLAVWSPVFAKLAAQVDGKEILAIQVNEDMDVVEAVIKYLYSSDYKKFIKMPVRKLVQAIEFTKRYEMGQVYQKCMKSLQRRKIHPQNVIEFFDYGLRKNISAVVNKCIKVFRYKGVKPKILKEDVSLDTMIAILDMGRVALQSEAELLSLAISWLSYPANGKYRSILSHIDLLSIEWTEYKNIVKKFPDFFTDSELSAILLGSIRQNHKHFPEWYKPKIRSVVKKTCSTCIFVQRQLKIRSDLYPLRETQRKDSRSFCLTFKITFDCLEKAKLLKAELNFGPNEIPEKSFVVTFSKNDVSDWKQCFINCTYNSHKYSAFFDEPPQLDSGDCLRLKFNFQKSVKNVIHVISPNIIQRKKVNKVLCKDESIRLKLLSAMAFYRVKSETPRFLLSSFNFHFCDHDMYLIRKYVTSHNIENTINVDKEDEILTMKDDDNQAVYHNFCAKDVDFKMETFSNDDTELRSKNEGTKMPIVHTHGTDLCPKDDLENKMNIIWTNDIKEEIIITSTAEDEYLKVQRVTKGTDVPKVDHNYCVNGEDFKMDITETGVIKWHGKDDALKTNIISSADIKKEVIYDE